MLEPETIKFCYSTHPQQTVVRNDYAYDAEPYSATSMDNVLSESYRLVGIKRGVVPLMLRILFAMHLQEQGEDLSYSQVLMSYSSTKTDEINKHTLTKDIGLIRNLLDDILAVTQNCCSFCANLGWKEQFIVPVKAK